MLIPSLHSIKLQPHVKFGPDPSKFEGYVPNFVILNFASNLNTYFALTASDFDGFRPNFMGGCSLILCKDGINKKFPQVLFSKFYLVKFKISDGQELKIFTK